MAVAEYGSYNEAADKAAMSNTAISEHLQRLKEQVGQELFVKRGLLYELTDAGLELQFFIKKLEAMSEEFKFQIEANASKLSGMVRYALPPSCLFSPHFPMLLEKRHSHPELELTVEAIPSDEVLEKVEDRTFDFGFVTEEISHPALSYEVFCEEEYILVGNSKDSVKASNAKALIETKFINYPGMGHYFNLWKNHFFPGEKRISHRSLHHAGDINSIDGAIKMVLGGLGIAVFPRHCVQEYLDQALLFEADQGETAPLMNAIHIVKRKSPELPRRVQVVIDWFFDMHPEYENQRAQQRASA